MSITSFPVSDVPSVSGNSNKVLTNNGSQAYWGPGSGMTLLGSVSANGTLVTISNIDQSYTDLRLVGVDIGTNGSGVCRLRVNGLTGSAFYGFSYFLSNATSAITHTTDLNGGQFMFSYTSSAGKVCSITDIYNYASTTKTVKPWRSMSDVHNTTSYRWNSWGGFNSTSTNQDGLANITSISMYNDNTWNGGTFYLYGVK